MSIQLSDGRGERKAKQLFVSAAALAIVAISGTPAVAQQTCPTESQFLMEISKQGLDRDRFYMVKSREADRLVDETVSRAGHFIPPYDYVLVIERDGYTSVNPVRDGAMCMHWRLNQRDWHIVKEAVYGKLS